VDHVIDTFGIRQFNVVDDNATASKKRILALCKELEKRKVYWKATMRAKPNDMEIFKAMVAGGCREIGIGVESGDPNVLAFLNKRATVEDNYTCIMNAKKTGLVVRLFFMINTPGESKETVSKNIKFLDSVDYDMISMTNFVPMPGSEVYNDPKKFDCRILHKDPDRYNTAMWLPTGPNISNDLIELDGLSLEELKRNRRRMYRYIQESGKSNLG